ncbi:DUF423 domain-containing protein [Flavobacterium sp. CYK-4]|uniref:DUF423 domain-containing protein n=1 Tax=Flavobacterium lotistagni TaxID=2709660 RepID=UPI00140B7A6F|nr:DUF423 domain-containing protein [Flavobacterium lotistagni]NHM05776.1 DUF423 domain-containing protein [Flavobacterium lotistagni]
MDKKIISTAALLGASAIILGAFGAHALKKVLTDSQLITFETGVKYQMYHALFLLFVGFSTSISVKAKQIIYYCVLTGVLFFSGSIYLLATDELNSFNFKTIGFVTPIGGFLLIIGWFWLFVDFYRKK